MRNVHVFSSSTFLMPTFFNGRMTTKQGAGIVELGETTTMGKPFRHLKEMKKVSI